MKKSIPLLLCILPAFSCVLLPGCRSGGKKDLSGSKYVGTWKAINLTLKDEVGEFDTDHFLTLNADGTAKFTSGEEVTNCTWEETNGGFKLKGDAKMSFTDDGDGIKCSLLGVELHFEKQP